MRSDAPAVRAGVGVRAGGACGANGGGRSACFVFPPGATLLQPIAFGVHRQAVKGYAGEALACKDRDPFLAGHCQSKSA